MLYHHEQLQVEGCRVALFFFGKIKVKMEILFFLRFIITRFQNDNNINHQIFIIGSNMYCFQNRKNPIKKKEANKN